MRRNHNNSSPLVIGISGWKEILARVWTDIFDDHISLVAAGVAFYGLFSLFPAIAAVIALSGLLLDPANVTHQLENFSGLLPKSAAGVVVGQATNVVSSGRTGLGITAILHS